MFSRKKSTTTGGGSILPPKPWPEPAGFETPAEPPVPVVTDVTRVATVIRARFLIEGSYHTARVYFTVICKDPEAESEAEEDRVYHSSCSVETTSGFANLEIGDKLTVTLTRDIGDWQLKNFDILFDIEAEKARLHSIKSGSTGGLPPRHPLTAPR